MKLKSLAVTVVVLAVLSAVAYWLNRPAPPPPPDARVGQPVLATAAIQRASAIEIADQGKTVKLTRRTDGEWTDDSYYGLPADFTKLSGMINDFTSAKISRLVTRSPERLARLGFDGTRFELIGRSGRPETEVNLGRNADQGGRFLRYGSEQKAYLADLNTWIDNDAKNWADAALLSVKPEDVSSVEFPFDASVPIVAVRATKNGPWTAKDLPAGQQLSADKVNSALSTLTALRFTDTSVPGGAQAMAARRRLRRFVLKTFDGRTITIDLGRKPEEKKVKPATHAPRTGVHPSVEMASRAPGVPAGHSQANAKASGAGHQAAKPAPKPEYVTIPAGPVYAFIHSSNPRATVDAMMKRRAFQIDEYTFTSLPQKSSDLLEPAPPPAPSKKGGHAPAGRHSKR
ncbi:MAG: DUF4340 domain-containing protein [Opitutaceae bacterium]